jgi:rhodanese-related sulfurtransferase
MKKIYYIVLFINMICFSQNSINEVLKKMNQNSVAYIQVEDLKKDSNCTILDAREKSEFEVSHIKNAIYVGHKKFSIKEIAKLVPEKSSKIVVYCSIGVRSEEIGEKLKKAGYTYVFNLYGGIFEWKNKGNQVFDNQNKETEKVHAFDKNWSIYLKKGEKIY